MAQKQAVFAAEAVDQGPGPVRASVVDKEDATLGADLACLHQPLQNLAQLPPALEDHSFLVVAGNHHGQLDRPWHFPM